MRLTVLTLFLISISLAQGQGVQMLKSLSGPSGHVSGAKFVFDETRTRFVYPQDKSLIVYFEWSASPGLHTISAVWKGPDGRPSSIPADIKIETPGTELTAYWTFDISPHDAAGIWTLEARVDGAPAGSHTFELYVPAAPATPAAAASAPASLSTDDVYRAALPSLVMIASAGRGGSAAGHFGGVCVREGSRSYRFSRHRWSDSHIDDVRRRDKRASSSIGRVGSQQGLGADSGRHLRP